MPDANQRRPRRRFASFRSRDDESEAWFERLIESAAAREARDLRDLEVSQPTDAAIEAALDRVFTRLLREAREEERELDDVARLQAVVTMLTRVPRDPLTTATSYLSRQAGTLEHESQVDVFLAETEAVADDLALRLPSLRHLVEAIQHDEELATQRHAESEEVLDARLEHAKTVLRTSAARMRKTTAGLKWSTLWPRLVRAVTLFAIAMGAWWLGDVVSDAIGLPQALIAASSFLVVDLVLIDMFVEPRLVDHRRKVLRRLAQRVCDVFRDVQRGIDGTSGTPPAPRA